MQPAADQIKSALLGKYPLIYMLTWEEPRALQLLEAFSAKVFNSAPLKIWSAVSGFDGLAGSSPLAAIQHIMNSEEKGFYLLKDFSPFMNDPTVVRALRDAYQALAGKEKYLVIVSPEIFVPESVKKEIFFIDLGLPDETEISKQIKKIQSTYPGVTLPEDLMGQMTMALKGLTLNEASHLLNRIFRGKRLDTAQVLAEVYAEKEMIVRKSGYLEFVPPNYDISGVGGLDNLKDWLVKREKLFSKKALEDGMPVPKGILVMGMSGCGKSLAAKAISSLWKVPLFRLDMNLIFSGMFGTPELAFHRALKTVEAVSPAVLWIDEIENSLAMDEGAGGGSSYIFSAFLTWMQEKPPLVFVAATANRIQAIPAEVIRKGRFDQVFFVDLPNDEERKQIFQIHLQRNHADIAKFDLVFLAAATKGWNGAEIEQVVSSARMEAYHEGREFTIDDITRITSRTVALAKTMEDQMKKIRSWAFGRATPASKYSTVTKF